MLQREFPDGQIVSDGGESKDGIIFQSSNTRCYATVNVRGVKYGAITNNRGKHCCHGYIEGRRAVQFEYILSISIPQGNAPPINLDVAIVRRFRDIDNCPIMPWSLL